MSGNTSDNYTRVEMPFNSVKTEFFEGKDINVLMQRMLAHIKTQAEDPRMRESGFTLDKIMHLHMNFPRLVLTRGDSYINLPKWIKSKCEVINPQDKDEQCFKWAVIVTYIIKRLQKIINVHRHWNLRKTNITGKDLSFQYQSKR